MGPLPLCPPWAARDRGRGAAGKCSRGARPGMMAPAPGAGRRCQRGEKPGFRVREKKNKKIGFKGHGDKKRGLGNGEKKGDLGDREEKGGKWGFRRWGGNNLGLGDGEKGRFFGILGLEKGIWGRKKKKKGFRGGGGRGPYLRVPSRIILRQSLKTSEKEAGSWQFWGKTRGFGGKQRGLGQNKGFGGIPHFLLLLGHSPASPKADEMAKMIKTVGFDSFWGLVTTICPKSTGIRRIWGENHSFCRVEATGGPKTHKFTPPGLTSTCSCLASTNGPNCEEMGKKSEENGHTGLKTAPKKGILMIFSH